MSTQKRRKIDSHEALALNSWIAKADSLYIDGRLLWFNHGIDGATILLWLSLEQLMKALMFQAMMQESELSYGVEQDVFKALDAKGHNFGHKVEDLVMQFNTRFADKIQEDGIATLEKLNEYFHRRYVRNSSTSINLDLIDAVDRLYFDLRDMVDARVPLAYIDEIGFRQANNLHHPLEAHMQYAYLSNVHFRRRKRYPTWRVQFNFTGPVYIDSGRSSPIRLEDLIDQTAP